MSTDIVVEQYDGGEKKEYRVYWNLNAGDKNQWCIDEGPGTKRMWAYKVIFLVASQTAPPTVFDITKHTHPKGWIEVTGYLRGDCEIRDEKIIFNVAGFWHTPRNP